MGPEMLTRPALHSPAESCPAPSIMGSLKEAAKKIGVGGLRHHVLICRGPDCCSMDRGDKIWKYLKTRLKELGLSGRCGTVNRSKIDCLQICQQGPIVLIYPEGTWYHKVD